MSTSIPRDYYDRDEVKRRAEEDFINLYLEHGGTQRWKKLTCLFHEDGQPSATIHRGRYHCFACNINLDPFDFVMRIQRTDFKGALAFLAARYNVPLRSGNLTDQERRGYARRLAAAELEARSLVVWKSCMVETVRDVREIYQRAYHRGIRYINRHGLNAPAANLAADVADLYEARYVDLDAAIERIQRAGYRKLLPFFRQRGRRAA